MKLGSRHVLHAVPSAPTATFVLVASFAIPSQSRLRWRLSTRLIWPVYIALITLVWPLVADVVEPALHPWTLVASNMFFAYGVSYWGYVALLLWRTWPRQAGGPQCWGDQQVSKCPAAAGGWWSALGLAGSKAAA